ncbi:hypothetical protein Tsubulata_000896 [Turnera subulata]|uniref:Uncharacterized protein n=1 Tax=Turnera subulata TaxID=218843 RepID=A0A9Q0IZJ3_9ROSI|nr:hypothetical protein Tsubulata_000896 [Turnera subulata]
MGLPLARPYSTAASSNPMRYYALSVVWNLKPLATSFFIVLSLGGYGLKHVIGGMHPGVCQ